MTSTSRMRDGCEVLIVGAGIIGLTVARTLWTRGIRDIVVVDKEPSLGRHASGRNSGVLHAGIYYAPGSLKARLCVEGNRRMKAYCRVKGLPLEEAGQVVVARREREVVRLEELQRRATAVGARAWLIDEHELAEIEPHARTVGKALYTPDTAVIDPHAILRALAEELQAQGVHILLGTTVLGPERDRVVRTSLGPIRYERLVNAAGLHADRLAHAFGVGRDYRILPFKGTYRRVRRSELVRGNVYPTPDLRFPFLGVHFTRRVTGEVWVGPTASPALGRERYGAGGDFSVETVTILIRLARLWMRNPAFRVAAWRAVRWTLPRAFYREARTLVPTLMPQDLGPIGEVGIRAQLVHAPTMTLVMDFVVIWDGETVHVLNAVSPAFTSAMAFADFIADQIE